MSFKYFYQKIYDAFATGGNAAFIVQDGQPVATYNQAFSICKKFNTSLSRIAQGPVILFADKSLETYCGIFSILLSGHSWLPVSPSQPEERFLEIIKAISPAAIVSDHELSTSLSAELSSNNIPVINYKEIQENAELDFDFNCSFNEDEIAYTLFTSGSTGKPKGVPMTHGNYIPFIKNALDILPIDKHEVFCDYHDFSFDLSIFYLFCAVLTQSAFAPALRAKDYLFLLKHSLDNNVTIFSSVPSTVRQVMKLRPSADYETKFKVMFLCGEPFQLDILKYCYENLKQKNVYNFYGLTETGVENFYHKCSKEDPDRFSEIGFVPIGKPLPGNPVKISDDNELLIGGPQITPGYIGGIEKQRFEIIDGELFYHSGDLVEVVDGYYFCKGRLDSQVKVDGYRIELGEIESALRTIEKITNAAVLVTEIAGRKKLHAFIETESECDNTYIVKQLKDKLPAYMIPAAYSFLKLFPKNRSGKLDRVALKGFLKND